MSPAPAPNPAPEFFLLFIDGDAHFANNNAAGVTGGRVPAATSAAHGANDID